MHTRSRSLLNSVAGQGQSQPGAATDTSRNLLRRAYRPRSIVTSAEIITRSSTRLLELPLEILQQILSLLLYQSTPIHDNILDEQFVVKADKNYHFHPKILSVCSQLHDVGKPLLDANILQVTIWPVGLDMDADRKICYLWLNNTPDKSFNSKLLSRFRNLHLIFPFEDTRVPIDKDVSSRYHSACQELVARLTSPRSRLSVTVKRWGRPFQLDDPIGESFLLPLVNLRATTAAFEGVQEGWEAEWQERIECCLKYGWPERTSISQGDALPHQFL